MVQWIRIYLEKKKKNLPGHQGTWVRSLVQEVSTGQQSPGTTSAEPVRWSPCSATREDTADRSPGTATRVPLTHN